MTAQERRVSSPALERRPDRSPWLSSLNGRPLTQYGVTQGVVVGIAFVLLGAASFGACEILPARTGCWGFLVFLLLGVVFLVIAASTVLLLRKRPAREQLPSEKQGSR